MQDEMEFSNLSLTKMKETQKMVFIFNAINDGWIVKKRDNIYIFSKKHHGNKKIFRSDYLDKFITLYMETH